MRIGFCFNVRHPELPGVSTETDFDFPETIENIARSIEDLGHPVLRIEVTPNIFNRLAELKNDIDLVFNIAEGLWGDARESWVPLACEILKIPYTHSSPTVLALCLDKSLAKLAVSGLGVKVPKSILVPEGFTPSGSIPFPVIIKPNAQGSSLGIFDANVVHDLPSLTSRIAQLRQDGLTGPLLVEQYIDGREFTVGLLGHNPTITLPIIEQIFTILPPGSNKIASYELKWLIEDSLADLSQAYNCPAVVTPSEQSQLETTSQAIFQSLNIRDCARIDYRLDAAGNLYFLEINPLPGLNPDPKVISYFPLACRVASIRFPQLLSSIISGAASRYHL
jgi:D-alanine--D-alanine ligase